MLISCPKCHSLYEIPDDLIGKTGQNFRCQACSTIWHAMPEDAIGYEEETEIKPLIEPISVAVPPYRHYPANKEVYTIPIDTKSGRRTRSSKQIIEDEGNPDYVPPKPKKKKELTLTSDTGTSFTISQDYHTEPEDKITPHFFEKEDTLHANKDNRLSENQKTSSPFFRRICCYLLLLLVAILLLRREVVSFYPTAEDWYNKVCLSGLHNPEYLKFENVMVEEVIKDNKPLLKITADITNNSRYGTDIPLITVSNSDKTFTPNRTFLTAHSKTDIEIFIPHTKQNAPLNLTLGFTKP